MKVIYKGQLVGEVVTNRSLTIEEALYALGYDVNSQEDLQKAYEKGEPWAYIDDGNYAWDFENFNN